MIRMIARAALTICLTAGLILSAIRLTAPAERLSTAFFEVSPACALPCWLEIHPGTTRLDQALLLLKSNGWIKRVNEVGAVASGGGFSTVVNWEWSESYPYGGSSRGIDGTLVAQNDIVQQIFLLTNLRFGDVWLALGKPDGGAVDYLVDSRQLRVENTAFFAAQGLSATVVAAGSCTSGATDFWQQRTSFWLRPGDTIPFAAVDYRLYVRAMHTGYHDDASFC